MALSLTTFPAYTEQIIDKQVCFCCQYLKFSVHNIHKYMYLKLCINPNSVTLWIRNKKLFVSAQPAVRNLSLHNGQDMLNFHVLHWIKWSKSVRIKQKQELHSKGKRKFKHEHHTTDIPKCTLVAKSHSPKTQKVTTYISVHHLWLLTRTNLN